MDDSPERGWLNVQRYARRLHRTAFFNERIAIPIFVKILSQVITPKCQREQHSWVYIQGAGDDEEHWSKGVSRPLLARTRFSLKTVSTALWMIRCCSHCIVLRSDIHGDATTLRIVWGVGRLGNAL